MRWPWISRKKHEAKRKEQEQIACNLRDMNTRLQYENSDERDKIARFMDDIAPKMVRVQQRANPDSLRYGFYVEWDWYYLEEILHQGDSLYAIKMIADHVGRRTQHELEHINRFGRKAPEHMTGRLR